MLIILKVRETTVMGEFDESRNGDFLPPFILTNPVFIQMLVVPGRDTLSNAPTFNSIATMSLWPASELYIDKTPDMISKRVNESSELAKLYRMQKFPKATALQN